MTVFSEHFGLGKSQAELDFVDIALDKDMKLFLDPFSIAQRPDRWSGDCHETIQCYFQSVLTAIREGKDDIAKELLSFLREPNETRLGFSKERPRGAGIGRHQSEQLYQALKGSSAVRTGFINNLEEAELLVDGIGRDKISDLTTNVLRRHLAEYTSEQCNLLGVEMSEIALGPCYYREEQRWRSEYLKLPVVDGRPVLLVPKAIVRYDPAYDHTKYYNGFVLSYLQVEHLNAGSALVRTLKNGSRRVYKKDIEARFPRTKENLYQFSKRNPEILREYRDYLEQMEKQGPASVVEPVTQQLLAKALAAALVSIPKGSADASAFHSMMIGVLEFLLFPNFLHPRKEKEIHDGRKRIDIVMENGAQDGIFQRLHSKRGLPCAFVAIECKNYTTEIANPELDQLGGRFSPNRGKLGILCCRGFEDRATFVRRCRDTFRDERGLIIPLDDTIVLRWLDLIAQGARRELEAEFTNAVDEIWYS